MATSEPHEPYYSCPKIDESLVDLENACKNLEELRTSNDQIRNWGRWYKERAEELEGELTDANNKIEELEESNKALEQDNKDLETELENVI